MLSLDRLTFDYQARYCEENVWRLLGRSDLSGRRGWAVIVSGLSGHVVALHQTAGRPRDGLVCWDYHVFAVVDDPEGPRLALDLDTALPFPCPLAPYLAATFPLTLPSVRLRHQRPRFRVLEAADYLAGLSSDRSHMRTPAGDYVAPPPPWPAPGSGKSNTLMTWIDVSVDAPGSLWDLDQMLAFAG
jgi:protein N-terminal glutamine amidohydrolase